MTDVKYILNTKIVNIAGNRYTRWAVVGYAGIGIKYNRAMWLCRCDCGTERIINGAELKRCRSKSCGCLGRELARDAHLIHGMEKTTEYKSWSSMKQRCLNKKSKDYKSYGGRGITVCERWMKFENFFADMGLKPSPKYSIDRTNNELGYFKENCHWATAKEQANNRRGRYDKV